jgi:hypothetical protein
MKLTGNLKKQVESAPTKEEKREAIKQAGILLTDDELDKVSGGASWPLIIMNVRNQNERRTGDFPSYASYSLFVSCFISSS